MCRASRCASRPNSSRRRSSRTVIFIVRSKSMVGRSRCPGRRSASIPKHSERYPKKLSRHSRESRNPGKVSRGCPWAPACAGETSISWPPAPIRRLTVPRRRCRSPGFACSISAGSSPARPRRAISPRWVPKSSRSRRPAAATPDVPRNCTPSSVRRSAASYLISKSRRVSPSRRRSLPNRTC